ncbi:DUF4129 domain-containing protein [Ideonella azotifigens]|uniref:Protein-glutamine gamma-glutamyltransferase-like C-terminal domain-containing protein n=2 Tax=Ideonella azotifigens TaxID=513160 RepID=A0ABN1KBW2_9BURK|nr:DUF4129 domain-containing protein [Ideonella azotifigens]MCD2343026.1 DUF4129 domain-containing protein [Ideonella azotifigens]
MRLRIEAVGLAGLLACGGVQAQPAPPSPAASAPTVTLATVRAATEAMNRDPLLHAEETRRTLKFDWESKPKKQDKPSPAPDWLITLAEWLAGAGRLLAWAGGLLLVALACVLGWRLWQRSMPTLAAAPVAPSHVGSLDIRPESLPEPLGQAAAALWHQGDARAALALLYRGVLSRLVHRHGVAIVAASTEAECLALASERLSPTAIEALRQLIDAWLEIGYAHRRPDEARVLDLCARFDALFGAGLAAQAAGGALRAATA